MKKIIQLFTTASLLWTTSALAFNCTNQYSPNVVGTGVTTDNFLSVCNSETFNVADGGIFNNYGGFSNTWNNSAFGNTQGQIIISSGGVWNNAGSLTNQNANLINYGTFNNTGSINSEIYGVINNLGTLINSGTITNNNASINNNTNAVLTNDGNFLINAYSNLNNSGTIINNGIITIDPNWQGYAYVNNSGVLINNGTLTTGYQASIVSSGTIVNNGNLTNNAGYYNITGSFTGNGTYTQRWGAPDSSDPWLKLQGSMTQSAINITEGVLEASGTIHAEVSVGGNPPFGSPRKASIRQDLTPLTIDGNLKFLYNSSLINDYSTAPVLDINISGLSEGTFSSLHVTGSTSFAAGLLKLNFSNFLPIIGDHWQFLTSDGGINGLENLIVDYTGLPPALDGRYSFKILAANGGAEVILAAVPEPESYAMLLSGLGLLGFLSCKRKQKHIMA